MFEVAKFEKVSLYQFQYDYMKYVCHMSEEQIADPKESKDFREHVEKFIYPNIQLPRRSTDGSAGYDFYLPLSYQTRIRKSLVVPSGIRVKIKPGWFLALVPRSGLGTRYRLQLDNTIGVVDSDYYNADNEGHILFSLTNDSDNTDHLLARVEGSLLAENKKLILNQGDRFAQGIFLPYGITTDDDPIKHKRVGGFGSTDELKGVVEFGTKE